MAVHEFKEKLSFMSVASGEWERLVNNWDTICSAIDEEDYATATLHIKGGAD